MAEGVGALRTLLQTGIFLPKFGVLLLWSSWLGGGLRWGRDHTGGVGVTSGHEVLNFPPCLGDSLSVCSSFSALERAA